MYSYIDYIIGFTQFNVLIKYASEHALSSTLIPTNQLAFQAPFEPPGMLRNLNKQTLLHLQLNFPHLPLSLL